MAAPIISAAVNAAGRQIFRKAGRFISKSTYLRELRRIPKGLEGAGRFVSAAKHARGLTKSGVAKLMKDIFGSPIGGGNWVSRVRESTEKFIELLGDENALG